MAFRSRFAVLVLLLTLASSQSFAQKHFAGPFLDFGANQEHVIGGSLIDGIDVLSEGIRTVFSAGVGYRYQFDMGLIVGASISKGWLDGDLDLGDQVLAVDWQNDSQWDWEVNAGWAFARRYHAFVFASEVTRKFEVDIVNGATDLSQADEQGMLRIGIGGEAYLVRGLSARLKIGTGRADFGDVVTNIDIGRKFHLSAGFRFTF